MWGRECFPHAAGFGESPGGMARGLQRVVARAEGGLWVAGPGFHSLGSWEAPAPPQGGLWPGNRSVRAKPHLLAPSGPSVMPPPVLQGQTGALGLAEDTPTPSSPEPGCPASSPFLLPGSRLPEPPGHCTRTHTRMEFISGYIWPCLASGEPRGHTLGFENSSHPSSWPILSRAAAAPMYTHPAAPIP